jgi:hypothetical protein
MGRPMPHFPVNREDFEILAFGCPSDAPRGTHVTIRVRPVKEGPSFSYYLTEEEFLAVVHELGELVRNAREAPLLAQYRDYRASPEAVPFEDSFAEIEGLIRAYMTAQRESRERRGV